MEKQQGVMVSQHSSGSAVAKLYTANYMNFLRVAGSKVNFLKTCEMLLSLRCTKTKEKSQIAQITEGSPYYPSLEKSLQEFSSTNLSLLLLQAISQKASAVSEPTEVPLTWFLCLHSFRKSAGSKIGDYT